MIARNKYSMALLVRVRMRTSIAGSVSADAGQIVEVDQATGRRLIASLQADQVDSVETAEVESATSVAPESAVRAKPRGRTRRGRARG